MHHLDDVLMFDYMVCTLEITCSRDKEVFLGGNGKFSKKQCILENALNMQDEFYRQLNEH